MILGHQKQWQFLKAMAERESFPHAYLFSGPEKLGKKKIALEWISLMLGQDLQKKSHPDLVLIEPEELDSKKTSTAKQEIKIDQIKDLIWKLSLKPSLASLKTAIIDGAHLMNQEAQTALLKTLEEPKGSTLLILITDKAQYLFPTILSRVQSLKFYPTEKAEIRKYLEEQKIPQNQAEEILEFCQGRPGVVIDFINDSQKIKVFEQRIKELQKVITSSLAFRFKYAKDISQESKTLKETLDIWLNYFRNILLSRLEKGDNPKGYSSRKLGKILKFIQKINFLISTTNVNSRLALENLMLEF